MEEEASCQQVVPEQLDSHAQSNSPQTLLITRRTIGNGPQTLLITRRTIGNGPQTLLITCRTIGPKEEICDRGLSDALLNSSQREL